MDFRVEDPKVVVNFLTKRRYISCIKTIRLIVALPGIFVIDERGIAGITNILRVLNRREWAGFTENGASSAEPSFGYSFAFRTVGTVRNHTKPFVALDTAPISSSLQAVRVLSHIINAQNEIPDSKKGSQPLHSNCHIAETMVDVR